MWMRFPHVDHRLLQVAGGCQPDRCFTFTFRLAGKSKQARFAGAAAAGPKASFVERAGRSRGTCSGHGTHLRLMVPTESKSYRKRFREQIVFVKQLDCAGKGSDECDDREHS